MLFSHQQRKLSFFLSLSSIAAMLVTASTRITRSRPTVVRSISIFALPHELIVASLVKVGRRSGLTPIRGECSRWRIVGNYWRSCRNSIVIPWKWRRKCAGKVVRRCVGHRWQLMLHVSHIVGNICLSGGRCACAKARLHRNHPIEHWLSWSFEYPRSSTEWLSRWHSTHRHGRPTVHHA